MAGSVRRGFRSRPCRRADEALHPAREPLGCWRTSGKGRASTTFRVNINRRQLRSGAAWSRLLGSKRTTPKNFLLNLISYFKVGTQQINPRKLADYSVCTTWGVKGKQVYLLHVLRKRLDYPALKRAVSEQAHTFQPTEILIEGKSSGTQLIQELMHGGMYGVRRYEPTNGQGHSSAFCDQHNRKWVCSPSRKGGISSGVSTRANKFSKSKI